GIALPDGDVVNYLLETFDAYAKLNFDRIAAPACFRLERDNSRSGVPLECQRIQPARVYVQKLASGNINWYSADQKKGNSVLVARGATAFGECPPDQGRCAIPFTPPPPLPTSAATAAPTAVGTPEITPVVLIAEFDARNVSKRVEIAHRLESNLRTDLRRNNLNNVTVKLISTPVTDDDEAEKLSQDEHGRVVIWGWYDDLGIQV